MHGRIPTCHTLGVLFMCATLSRCDCGGSVVGRDRGHLVLLDTGPAAIDAATDSGPLDAAARLDSAQDAILDATGPDAAAMADRPASDAQVHQDSASTHDGSPADSAADSAAAMDAAPATDATGEPDSAASMDANIDDAGGCATRCVPVDGACRVCVDIFIDNFCSTSVAPSAVDVPADTTLTLTFVNRSLDYAANVWSSRGYGYVELPTGAIWEDPIWHCTGPEHYVEYFDVSIDGGGSACPGVRLNMNCQ